MLMASAVPCPACTGQRAFSALDGPYGPQRITYAD